MFSREDKIQLSRAMYILESCLSSQFGNRTAEKEEKNPSDHKLGTELRTW